MLCYRLLRPLLGETKRTIFLSKSPIVLFVSCGQFSHGGVLKSYPGAKCWTRFFKNGNRWLGKRSWRYTSICEVSTSDDQKRDESSKYLEDYPKTRFQRTKETLKETKRKVTEQVEETKRLVSERIGVYKENIFTVPNGLSMMRICSTPLLGYLVMTESFTPALILFSLSGVTDVLDGYIARNFKGQTSNLGTLLDPMADKFLVATLFLTLTAVGLIPVPLTGLIIMRDSCLVLSAFYLRYQSLPPPKTVSRYFDVTLATVKLSPTAISKLNTAVQLGLVAVTLAAPVFNYVDHSYLHMLWYVTASTTILSGLSYVFAKDSYKFLRSKNE